MPATPDPEEETGFVVRDRRRFNSDATATPPATPEPAAPAVAAPPSPPAPSLLDLNAAFVAGGSGGELSPDQDYDLEDPDGAEGEFGAEDDSSLPDVYSVLALFLGELRNLSLVRLGLVANPVTGQTERDMEQAKVAIDTVTFLASQLDAVISPEERLPLKAMVSDLQVNFVEQTRRGG